MHRKHTLSLRYKDQSFNVFFGGIIAIQSDNHTKPVNTAREQNAICLRQSTWCTHRRPLCFRNRVNVNVL